LKSQNTAILGENIIFRHATGKDINNFVNAGFAEVNEVNLSFVGRVFQAANGMPRQTGLVAYNVQEKCAIGFLSLVKHTKWLCSIRHLFTNPAFKKMGVATGLINYASIEAKKRGARKEFLDVLIDNFYAIDFFSKLGFKKASTTSIVNLRGSLASCARKFPLEHKNQLISLNTSSKKNFASHFSIYQRCMGHEWTDYFETDNNNLINGFAQDYRRFFSKEALINDSSDFLALVFKLPPFSSASLELYNTSSSTILPLLGDLFEKLQRKEISWINMRIFNMNSDDYSCAQLLNARADSELAQWQTFIMGRSL